MNRKALDLASIIVLLAFIEVHFLQLAGTDFPFYGLLKVAITLNLIVPFVALIVRVVDRLNRKAKDNAITVGLINNRLCCYIEGDDNEIVVDSAFSTQDHLIAYPEVFEKALNDVLRLSLKNKGLLTTAPFVVLKLDFGLLSKIEQKELVKLCISAGALDCIIAESNASQSEIQESINNYSLANFA